MRPVHREIKLERKRRDRHYLRGQIRSLENVAARSWLSPSDAEKLRLYRHKLEKLRK